MEIALKQGVVKIDKEDYPLFSKYHWHIEARGWVRTTVPDDNGLYTRPIPLHKMLMGTPPKGKRVRFLNGDRTDCRRRNLAFQTPSEIKMATQRSK